MQPSMPGRKARPCLLLAGLATLAALTLGACTTGSAGPSSGAPTTGATAGAPTSPAPAATGTPDATDGAGATSDAPSTTAPPAHYVHVMLLNSDGATYGVGMPVIAYFSHKITDAKAWQDDTKVSVNGRPVTAAWYFETSGAHQGYPYEAHLRLKGYWPADATIHIDFPPRGTPVGPGYAVDGKLTSLDFRTGDRHIAVVNDRTHTITVTSGGKPVYTFPVSLGAKETPTASGVKVIMEKGRSICMSGTPPNAPPYHECGVKFTQRLTYGGEYLHAAPWNCTGHPGCTGPANNIGSSDSSNGCTNLRPADAKTLYKFLRIGDVVKFPHTDGPPMTLGAGYGDWNVPWSTWLTGGAVPTTT